MDIALIHLSEFAFAHPVKLALAALLTLHALYLALRVIFSGKNSVRHLPTPVRLQQPYASYSTEQDSLVHHGCGVTKSWSLTNHLAWLTTTGSINSTPQFSE